MGTYTARVRVEPALRDLLTARHRGGDVPVPVDGVSSLTHLVESLGVPRTEIGELRANGRPVRPSDRPAAGDVIDVAAVRRPQRLAELRFVLDVHLGTLARRMRLLGLDTAYRTDATDPELVAQAIAERRMLLTRDRGLLRRRALPAGAYVRGDDPADQLADVLDRFDPPLVPWTRCPACNGELQPVPKPEVEHLLEPGTRRSYDRFHRCTACRRPYWHGAHGDALDAVVTAAVSRRATGH